MREMLYEQYLYYKSHDDTTVKQTNGQLMGSPLSFPVLCAANWCAYLLAYKRHYGIEIPFHKAPVLCNGDDFLFKSSKEFYLTWRSVIEELGFTLSVGKSYFDKRFLTLNSKFYTVTRTSVKSKIVPNLTKVEFREITFFNPAQVLPIHYFNDLVEQSEGQDFVARGSDALKRTSDPRYVFGLFVFFNRKQIDMATRKGRYNLAIHRDLGGLGMENIPDPSYTFKQKCLAHYMRRRHCKQVCYLTASSLTEGFMSLRCDTKKRARAYARSEIFIPESCVLDELPTKLNHTTREKQYRIWRHRWLRVPKKEPPYQGDLQAPPYCEEVILKEEDIRLESKFKEFGIPIGMVRQFEKCETNLAGMHVMHDSML
jgi:hypothetical protein